MIAFEFNEGLFEKKGDLRKPHATARSPAKNYRSTEITLPFLFKRISKDMVVVV
ncbi:hypothetical protein D3C87_445840 [compost metagenome]